MSYYMEPSTGRLPARLTSPETIGWLGVALGVIAFWIAIPPFTARAFFWPIILGLTAAAAGTWTIRRGLVKLGWGAVVSGAVGTGLGILATHSSSANLEQVFTASLIASMFVFATPLIFGSIGGMFSERSGVVNIGLEGMMLMGAFFGIYGTDKFNSWELGLVTAIVAGGLTALVHAFFSIQLRADQIVGGTAVNFLALGVTGYFFYQLYSGANIPSDIPRIPNIDLHIDGVRFFGQAFGDLNLMTWLAFLLVPLSYVVMFKTAIGLRIRACGEHPRAADTVGINVYAVRYASVVLSGMLAALGGAFLSVGFVGTFNENMTAGRGFIALAALIFGKWRPFGAFYAALLFGFSTALAFRLPVYSGSAATLFQALPYVLTIVAVAGLIGRSIPPAAVGRPYRKQ